MSPSSVTARMWSESSRPSSWSAMRTPAPCPTAPRGWTSSASGRPSTRTATTSSPTVRW